MANLSGRSSASGPNNTGLGSASPGREPTWRAAWRSEAAAGRGAVAGRPLSTAELPRGGYRPPGSRGPGRQPLAASEDGRTDAGARAQAPLPSGAEVALRTDGTQRMRVEFDFHGISQQLGAHSRAAGAVMTHGDTRFPASSRSCGTVSARAISPRRAGGSWRRRFEVAFVRPGGRRPDQFDGVSEAAARPVVPAHSVRFSTGSAVAAADEASTQARMAGNECQGSARHHRDRSIALPLHSGAFCSLSIPVRLVIQTEDSSRNTPDTVAFFLLRWHDGRSSNNRRRRHWPKISCTSTSVGPDDPWPQRRTMKDVQLVGRRRQPFEV